MTGETTISTENYDDFLEKIIVSCNEMRKDIADLKADLVKLATDFETFRNNYIGDA